MILLLLLLSLLVLVSLLLLLLLLAPILISTCEDRYVIYINFCNISCIRSAFCIGVADICKAREPGEGSKRGRGKKIFSYYTQEGFRE